MFEELMRQLRALDGQRLPIQLALDSDGYLDRECPQCALEFKVLFADWRDKVKDVGAYCPYCGAEAAATEWNTPQQGESFKNQALGQVHKQLNEALRTDVSRFNARQSPGGFISMRLDHRPGSMPRAIPVAAAAEMRQKLVCEVCACHYASIGAAFFCPACGHNSAVLMFEGTVQHIRRTLSALDRVEGALAGAFDADTARETARRLTEDALENLVSAYQRYAEALYSSIRDAPPARRNVFQTVSEASDLWRGAFGCGYEELLSQGEVQAFAVYLQQRHLLAHKDGLVDRDYIERSGDVKYVEGQRLVISTSAVLELADLVEKLAAHIRNRMPRHD